MAAVIELDDYGFTDGQNITSDIATIVTAQAPDFKIRMPSTALQLLVDYTAVDCTGGDFQILAGHADASLKATSSKIFEVTAPDNVLLESGVTIAGDIAGTPLGTVNDALIKVNATNKPDVSGHFESHANFQDSTENGLGLLGGSRGSETGRFATLNITGTYTDSSPWVNGGASTGVINITMTDPNGIGGRHEGAVNDVGGTFIKRRIATVMNFDDVTVVNYLKYGYARWFHLLNGKINATITGEWLGYLSDETTALPTAFTDVTDPNPTPEFWGALQQVGKVDTMVGDGPHYYNLTDTNINPSWRCALFEATPGPTNNINVVANTSNTVELYINNAENPKDNYNMSLTGSCGSVACGPRSYLHDLTVTGNLRIHDDVEGYLYGVTRLKDVSVSGDLLVNNTDDLIVLDETRVTISGTETIDDPANLVRL